MDRSIIRLLALQYANDELDVLEYLKARSSLLDDIEAGRIDIERWPIDAPPPRFDARSGELPSPATTGRERGASQGRQSGARSGTTTKPPPRSGAPGAELREQLPTNWRTRWRPPTALVLALGTVLVVTLAATARWWGHEPTPRSGHRAPSASPTISAETARHPAHEPSSTSPEIDSEIEVLLRTPHWTRLHLQEFELAWASLDANELAKVRQTPAFGRLRERIVTIIETQRAMARPGDNPRDPGTWARLSVFATTLGLEAPFPLASEPASPAPADAATSSREPHLAPAVPAGADPAISKGDDLPPPPDWFARQAPKHYTIQLVTASSAERARRLVRRFPTLDLKVQQSASTPYLYRVVHGSFPDGDRADQASEALPSALLDLVGTPYVRQFAHLLGHQLQQ